MPGRRLFPAALAAIVAGAFLALAGPARPAAAAFADECATPTSTLSGGSAAPLSVGAGQTVLLTGGAYTGGIDTLAFGGRICVAAGASLAPPYVNNGAGSILVRGSLTLPSIAVLTGFAIDNEAGVTLAGSLNTNGLAVLTNRAGATLTATQTLVLSNGSVLNNAGTADLPAGLILNTQAALQNTGTVTASSLVASGPITNSGQLTVTGSMTTNSGSSLTNQCRVDVASGLILNAQTVNNGVIAVTGKVTNNSTLNQSTVGIVTGADFTNDATVTGFGRYLFTGATSTQGQFVGADAQVPITFFDTTSGGAIFDVSSGAVANVVRGPVTPPAADFHPASCAVGLPTPSADLEATKTGPASVAPNGTLTYILTVTNHGPDPAADVVVSDDLPAPLTGVVTVPGTTRAGNTVSRPIGTLAAGASTTIEVTATAPASGTLVNVVRASSSTPDPDPTNNNGSLPAAQVTTEVVVPPVNHPPVLTDAEFVVPVDTPAFGVVPFSDPDAGQAVALSLTAAPSHGTVVLQSNGVFAYQPAPNFTGRDTFTANGCDNGTPVLCDTATITIVVLPVAANLSVATPQDTPILIPVSDNDRGDNGPPTIVDQPSHGTVVVNADGSVTYQPDPGFVGSDLFTYQICSVVTPDVCAQGTISVSVTPPANQPPVVEDSTRSTPVDTPVDGLVTVSDPDPGQTLTASLGTPPSAGTATVTPDGHYHYTPPNGFSGVVTFTEQVCDNGTPPLCGTGTVTITVEPVANPDAASTTAGTPVDLDVLANDLGVAAPPVIVTPPSGGTAVVQPDGTIRYTPAAGTTTDSFTYRACSPNDATLCATATATIEVGTLANFPPVLADRDRSTIVDTPISGRLVGADPDGDTLTYHRVTAPAHGTATVSASGAWTYTPASGFAGTDSFTVEACDPSSACTQAQVHVTVFPIAFPDTGVTHANVGTTLPVTANDLGTIGAPTITTGPGHGTATVTGTSIAYRPAPEFTGVDTLTYQVCAAPGGTPCARAAVEIIVAPVAVNDAAVTFAGRPVVIAIGANDAGTTAAPTIVVPPAHGQITAVAGHGVRTVLTGSGAAIDLLNHSSRATYQPDDGFTGYDQFTYQVCAPTAPTVCALAVVTVTVLPRLRGDLADTTDGQPVDIPVGANDFGDAGAPTVTSPPTRGTVRVLADGSIRYSPLPGFVGTDVFTYERCSPSAPDVCSTAEVVVTVGAAPVSPPSGPTPGMPVSEPVLPATGNPLRWLAGTGLALLLAGALLRWRGRPARPRRRPGQAGTQPTP